PVLTLRNFIWIGLLSLFSSVCFAQSPCVEVEGVAQIEQGDLAYARQMAIRDALAQAALSTNVRVNAQSETQNFALTRQSAQFAAQQRVTSMKVLSEVQEGNTIRVSVSACLTDEAKVCPNYIARYVPKVAIASVAVQDEYSVKDILDVAPGYQGELFNRLWSSGQRNVELLHTASDLYVGRPIVPNLSSTMLQTASDRTLAQYLVLTVIRSADWEVEQSAVAGEIRKAFRFDKEPTQRTVSVEWYVIDLIQERLLVQGNAFKKVGDADVRVGRDKPFASRQFFVTPTGKLFDYVLNEQVASIQESLACAPISATIAEVNQDKVVVPISIDSGVAQGDVLAVYSRTSRPYRIGAIELGTDLEPTAFIRVQKVLPRFIVGQFEGKKGLVQAGDIVKSW
ncbi:MAG TPA: flagellar assembly protein T N-terminal domain-containing protein, partial [Thiotrichales bacterium]|nr:flagellar assembly protein T N-terminal domain-containing protein [Thiotrichales bacterium]